jgi:hypothetical protein
MRRSPHHQTPLCPKEKIKTPPHPSTLRKQAPFSSVGFSLRHRNATTRSLILGAYRDIVLFAFCTAGLS